MNENKITKLKEKIDRKEQLVRDIQVSLKTDKNRLKQMEQLRIVPAVEAQPTESVKQKRKREYLTLECAENMGLHNKPCKTPYARCGLHDVMLSYQDVRARKCVMKLCKHLSDDIYSVFDKVGRNG